MAKTPKESPPDILPKTAREEGSGKSSSSIVRTEPPTRIVDKMRRGNYTTITKAIEAANNGDRIIIRPGLYKEGLTITKVLEIISEGNVEDVVVEANKGNALLFQAAFGRIVNLTLRQIGAGEYYCVDIPQGRIELEGCDIYCQRGTCVAIHEGADPVLRRNRIHDGCKGGVHIFKNGRGTLEDNDIFGNTLSGIDISTGSDPMLRRNRVYDCKQAGIAIYDNGHGTLEDNDIFSNHFSGVEVMIDSNPTLRRNRIHDGNGNGVYIYDNGRGTLENNDIFSNRLSGIAVTTGGSPTLRNNRINKNEDFAVRLDGYGGGIFEDNDLRDNGEGAWCISEDSKSTWINIRNKEFY